MHRYGFELVTKDGGEIWISVFDDAPELWTREHALACIEEVMRAVPKISTEGEN